MNPRTASIRDDFDRLAAFGDDWDHGCRYHRFLLERLPARTEAVLEIGCGGGRLTRRLADRARRVVALDLSPGMIELARRRCAGASNVAFLEADAMSWRWPRATFDAVVSVAALHHLPARDALGRMRDALRPGGVLLVLDLVRDRTAADVLRSLAAPPVALLLRRRHTGRWRQPAAVRRAWRAHGASDVYPDLGAVRDTCRAVLGGAEVRRHLLWRYSIIWRKPP